MRRGAATASASTARRRLLCAALLLGAVRLAAPARAADGAAAPPAAQPPPLAAFFSNAQLDGAKLSPDGKSVALRLAEPPLRDGLVVIDLDTLALRRVARFGNVDIGNFDWVNGQRLVFDTRDQSRAPGARQRGNGLFAIDHDGGNFRQLAETSYTPPSSGASMVKRNVQPWHTYLLGQTGAQDSSALYVRRAVWRGAGGDFERWDLLRLDSATGAATVVPAPGAVQQWLLDARGAPRLAVSQEDGVASVHYLEPASGTWRRLAQFPAYGDSADAFTPLGFDSAGQLYVSSQAGGDKRAVHLLDLASGKVDAAPLIALGDYDFDGELVYGKGRLLGARVLSDARGSVWFDAAMAEAQRRVDTLLPGTVNLLSAARRADSPWLLVQVLADTQPSAFLLYHSGSGALKTLGLSRPDIVPAQMAKLDLVRYPARDGLSIPAWLTLPRGGGRQLPMVLLVHGGPYARGGEWAWDAEAQFLASRGYAVLQPEFRGSTGFGAKHFRAGWKQWGLAMQDDLADGARWAVAQGIADPQRICIAGASYGGYAALMGLVNDPELYRCGVAWAGVTDIGKMYSNRHGMLSDLGGDWRDYGMPALLGDPVEDAARFQATSPLAQAARIKQPLLLAYGSDDRRVPLYQGEQFYAAVKRGNPQVEWVVYPGEGHGWSLAQNRIDFWGRVERFLAKHIGPR